MVRRVDNTIVGDLGDGLIAWELDKERITISAFTMAGRETVVQIPEEQIPDLCQFAECAGMIYTGVTYEQAETTGGIEKVQRSLDNDAEGRIEGLLGADVSV